MSQDSFVERFHKGYSQTMSMDRPICCLEGDQDLLIFENSIWGRVMALDGVIQSTERDEFIYSEMFAHVPLLSMDNPSSVLIIGGGDGAVLREVLKHQSVQKVVLVEFDMNVIQTTKEYLPNHCENAFEDDRLELIVGDGFDFVHENKFKFDVILCDSTDPIGAAAKLFSDQFYALCLDSLSSQGVMMTQNGVSMLQLDQLVKGYHSMERIFDYNGVVFANVPTYTGGMMSLAWGGFVKLEDNTLSAIQQRFSQSGIKTQYYNPQMHLASMAMPQYIIKEINQH
ncbi:MAG TPA: polyamine aminopropyltransferase [Gammaproteobacteria bacterium]|nr:polyamine aminopropyltransferase [Gammaproteobacteria bacterium]